MNVVLDSPRTIHFVGIGGIGVSALAKVLLERGNTITGSDLRLSSITRRLEEMGARIYSGHRTENLGRPHFVVVSSAVPSANPEVTEAKALGIPIIKRAEMLGRLMADKRGIAVAGTHGKTTTSALISLILERAGLDPTVLVGGEIKELGTNAKAGTGEFLVAEADEFDGSFLHLTPYIAVVTNVEPEHLDYYGTFPSVVEAFRRFAALVPPQGYVVACGDDPVLSALQKNEGAMANGASERIWPADLNTMNITTYGFGPYVAWQASDLRLNTLGGTDFTVLKEGRPWGKFSLKIPGRHNVCNGLAALAVGNILGVPQNVMREVLSSFQGVKRRFDLMGVAKGITVIDDYAHHPTEIKATLAAARSRFGGRRIVCVFQPHTYSRTKLLMEEFAQAFHEADEVIITDIYAAREENTWGVSGADLANALRHPQVYYASLLEEAAERALQNLNKQDVLMVMGAGDVYRVGEMVLSKLTQGQ